MTDTAADPIDTTAPVEDAPAVATPATLSDFYKDDAPRDAEPDPEAIEGEEATVDPDVPEAEPEEPAPEPEPEPIAAPVSWSKEDKAEWDAIPRAQQEIITRREAERDKLIRAKTMEASQTEQRVQAQAREALLTIQQDNMARIQQYAQMLDPQEPDARLLHSRNPEDYALYTEQDRQYRVATAHRENLTNQYRQAQQQAEMIEQQQRQAEIQQEAQRLETEVPEWSDPSERANLLAKLEPIAAELGYSAEVMSQANATDILGLKKVAEWKAKAEKLDAINKQKMVPVREARNTPPVARPGARPSVAQQRPADVLSVLYPDDVRRN